MDNSLRFASVDIGSNAVRLFFSYVFETEDGPFFKKASLIRLPIRLGEDSFHQKKLPQAKIDKIVEAMLGFTHLMNSFGVISYRACATSAMRDAINGKEAVQEIFERSGIQIELIDGEAEAALIFENHVAEKIDSKRAFIYMDVGGGSTEYTVFEKGEKQLSKSFNIGTIRLKDDLVEEETWSALKDWLKKVKKKFEPSLLIGSGGNINTLFKLSQKREMQPLELNEIKDWHQKLKRLSFDEKIGKLGLRPDRADVIVPATELFLFALNKSGAKKVVVPKVGLVDGIIHQLYDQYKQSLDIKD